MCIKVTQAVFLTVGGIVVLAASQTDSTLDFGENVAMTFTASIGQQFMVRLPTCVACGCDWQVESPSNGLTINGPSQFRLNVHVRGGGALSMFEIVPTEALHADILFAYKNLEGTREKTVALNLTVELPAKLGVGELDIGDRHGEYNGLVVQEVLPAGKTVDFGDHAEMSYEASVGKTFRVRLSGCGGCGFEWHVESAPNGLTIIGPIKFRSNVHVRGGESLTVFELMATEALQSDIIFVYKRSWENASYNTSVLHLSTTSDRDAEDITFTGRSNVSSRRDNASGSNATSMVR